MMSLQWWTHVPRGQSEACRHPSEGRDRSWLYLQGRPQSRSSVCEEVTSGKRKSNTVSCWQYVEVCSWWIHSGPVQTEQQTTAFFLSQCQDFERHTVNCDTQSLQKLGSQSQNLNHVYEVKFLRVPSCFNLADVLCTCHGVPSKLYLLEVWSPDEESCQSEKKSLNSFLILFFHFFFFKGGLLGYSNNTLK